MTQPAPATTYKPRSRKLWWSITAAAIFAAIAIPAVLAATEASSQTPTPPDCIAEGSCYETRADAPEHQQDCLRSEVRNGQTVFVNGEGRQPNGDYRYTAANCRNR